MTGVKVPSVNRRYTKEVPFLPRCIYEGKGLDLKTEPS